MRRYVLAVTTAAVAAVVSFAGSATAAPADPPVSGDDRATAHSGNVVGSDCGDLFAGSSVIASGDLTSSQDGTYIDITAVANGVDVVGVIVKGGPAYNVYKPGDLGDLPWLDLHSPLVPSGGPAGISHWFACGTGSSTTTTTHTPPDTTTTTGSESSETSTTSTPAGLETESTTTTSESDVAGATVTTTTSADVSPTAQDEDLASTGFNGGWLIALAALLLVGGAALLVIVRLRAARR